jgi:hypothetical protein
VSTETDADDAMTVRETRAAYFAKSGFDDRSYTSSTFTLPFGPLRLTLPNTRGRRAALPIHDIGHVVNGYGTDWVGEIEEAAYEVGAGCSSFYAAWMLNLTALLGGLFRCPSRMLRAFARGRVARASLYTEMRHGFTPAVLSESLTALRARVGADPHIAVGAVDVIVFSMWWMLSLMLHTSPLVTVAATWLALR